MNKFLSGVLMAAVSSLIAIIIYEGFFREIINRMRMQAVKRG